jgi:hypothetical protein
MRVKAALGVTVCALVLLLDSHQAIYAFDSGCVFVSPDSLRNVCDSTVSVKFEIDSRIYNVQIDGKQQVNLSGRHGIISILRVVQD